MANGPWVHLGFQWECTLDPCPEWSEGDKRDGGSDTFQNPDRARRVMAAARRHANRTGHRAIVDRHSRFIIEPTEGRDNLEGK